MAARRPTLVRRLLRKADDVVSTRAPRLSERAYRAVAAPLQAADPTAAARRMQSRLDEISEQVRARATRGRISSGDHRRFQRDLARTRDDLARLAPQLPAVQARLLARRAAAYAEAVARLPGAPGARRRPASLVEAVALGGAAATASAAVLVPMAPVLEGGLVVGAASAIGVTAAQRARTRRQLVAQVAEELVAVDRTALGPDDVDLRDLDARRRELTGRTLVSGRLDSHGTETLHRINAHLDGLLVRIVDGDLEADASHLTRSTVTTYLPDTLEPLLALRDPRALVDGRPACIEVGEQLAALERALAEVAGRPGRNQPENLLLLQREFLRSKFGETSL